MILAAGAGSRLRPLTDTIPKPLIEVGGMTLLERVARRLIEAGADRLIVNVHHHPEQIERHIADLVLPVEVRISSEPERALETGGGLLHAESLFRRREPFLLHNADVISEIDLVGLLDARTETNALATLAVHERETSRFLLFDRAGLLGWENVAEGTSERVRVPEGELRRLAFAGIHAVHPRLFDLIEERGVFSIVTTYLRLSASGHPILPHDVTGATWYEIGNPARLDAARRAFGG